jgi:hypothetical protein
MVQKKGNPTAVVESPESDEQRQEQADQAWDRMWRAIDQIRERNADKDPDEELTFITQVVDEVRQERYERKQRESAQAEPEGRR